MPYATLDDVIAAVCDQYACLPAAGFEDDAKLAAGIDGLRAEHRSRDRSLSEATCFCVKRYVDAELDYTTQGNRGLGRMTDHVPRFAAKHRRVFKLLPVATLDEFRFALSRHVLCGYLLFDMLFSFANADAVQLSNNALFQRWLPRIYQPPRELIAARNKNSEVWEVWFVGTAKPFVQLAIRSGITWDGRDAIGTDQAILTHYSTAGMVLRYSEADFAEPH